MTGEVHVYDEGAVAVMADPEGTEFCIVGPTPRGSPVERWLRCVLRQRVEQACPRVPLSAVAVKDQPLGRR